MQRVIKHNIAGIKLGFKHYPFAAWLIVYLFIVFTAWPLLNFLFLLAGNTVAWAILSLTPLYLYFRAKKQLALQEANNKANFQHEKSLTIHQMERIQKLLPTNQLGLFNSVLLPSLRSLHASLSEVVLHKDEHGLTITLFDKKFDEVCQALKRLTAQPGLYSTEQQYKSRDLAIMAFTFYRVLYTDVLDQFYKEDKNNICDDQDVYILLKRTPMKLIDYLGASPWRLYEFQTLIMGSLSSLVLNADIADYLVIGCNEEKIATEPVSITDLNENLVKKEEIVCAKIQIQAKNSQEESTEPVIDSSNEVLPAENKPTNLKSEDHEIATQFISWLTDRVNHRDKRYHPNEGKLVFSETLRYGEDTLFLSDQLFDQYHNVRSILPEAIRSALIIEKRSDNKSYSLSENGVGINLFRVNSIQVKQSPNKTVNIKEDNPDGNETTN